MGSYWAETNEKEKAMCFIYYFFWGWTVGKEEDFQDSFSLF